MNELEIVRDILDAAEYFGIKNEVMTAAIEQKTINSQLTMIEALHIGIDLWTK